MAGKVNRESCCGNAGTSCSLELLDGDGGVAMTLLCALVSQETVVAVFSDNAEIAAKARAANVNHKAALLGRKLLKRVRTKGVHVENQKRIANAAGTLTVRSVISVLITRLYCISDS